jgi:ADP-ribosyl-[dinitrogen reductase] hydrolase
MAVTPRDPLRDRARAAYLGLAVGDALGATVEFMTPKEIQHKHGVHKQIIGGGWLCLKPGHVTDDTTMTLALGNAILDQGGAIRGDAVARAFDAWMRAKPVDIGNTVRRGIVEFRRTGDTVRPVNEHEAGNGAAMRLLPAALVSLGQPESKVVAAILTQAHVTHHNPQSDACCITLALMQQDLLTGQPLAAARCRAEALATDMPAFEFRHKRMDNPSGWVVDTFIAVCQALFGTTSFEDCLIDIVNRGGDADTTGAIAGMLAGAHYGFDAIPRRWLHDLDKKAHADCEHQADRITALIAHSALPALAA